MKNNFKFEHAWDRIKELSIQGLNSKQICEKITEEGYRNSKGHIFSKESVCVTLSRLRRSGLLPKGKRERSKFYSKEPILLSTPTTTPKGYCLYGEPDFIAAMLKRVS